MNERVKELAEQAGFEFNSLGGTYTTGTLSDNLEKFAELIVKECIYIINQPNGVGDNDVIQITDDIEKHFGVEA